MTRILETTNYGKFELLCINRDVSKTKALEASMKKYGWISAYPAHVVKNGNGKLKIKAGHHRFTVAQKLGIPVKYVVCEDHSTVHELEKATRQWSIKDYLTSYVRAGEPEYVAFQDFIDKTHLPLNSCISMLAGQWAGSGNHLDSFKNGNYEIKTTEHAEMVFTIVNTMKSVGIKWAFETLPVQAVSKIVMEPTISINQLIKRIKTWSSLITKHTNIQQYLTMFEEVYNFKSRERVPLAHIINESSKMRQKNFGQA